MLQREFSYFKISCHTSLLWLRRTLIKAGTVFMLTRGHNMAD